MEIHGLQKLTLLDYPGRTALHGFHRALQLPVSVLPQRGAGAGAGEPAGTAGGGDPSVFRKTAAAAGRGGRHGRGTHAPGRPAGVSAPVKDLGYAVKLDTNGTRPGVLRALLGEGLVDYVAMDVKAAPEKYAAAVGLPACDLAPVRESAALLMEGAVDFEFRTTVVEQLHAPEDFDAVGRWLRGEEKYFLQAFRDSGDLIQPGLQGCSRERMQAMLDRLRPYVPRAALRGVDE